MKGIQGKFTVKKLNHDDYQNQESQKKMYSTVHPLFRIGTTYSKAPTQQESDIKNMKKVNDAKNKTFDSVLSTNIKVTPDLEKVRCPSS